MTIDDIHDLFAFDRRETVRILAALPGRAP